jgi:hypothetical protein
MQPSVQMLWLLIANCTCIVSIPVVLSRHLLHHSIHHPMPSCLTSPCLLVVGDVIPLSPVKVPVQNLCTYAPGADSVPAPLQQPLEQPSKPPAPVAPAHLHPSFIYTCAPVHLITCAPVHLHLHLHLCNCHTCTSSALAPMHLCLVHLCTCKINSTITFA